MEEKYKELLALSGELSDLGSASAVLNWDQQTYMPPGGAPARGQSLATLGRIIQEKFTNKKVGKLIEELEKWAKDLDPDSDEARAIKVSRIAYDKATKVPPEMVEERAKMTTAAQQAWGEAREKSEWPIFEPHMEKVVDFMQRYADLFKPYDHPYDTLLDDYEPKMKTAEVKEIFNGIRPKQVELISAIAEKPEIDDSCLHQHFPAEKQIEAGKEVMTAMGYDWNRGRMDKVHHPFAINLGYGDQRITYRVDENFLNPFFYAGMHEAGHAMYEQGIPQEYYRTPLYGPASLAIHESQSRLWENLVGRSRAFTDWYYPKLQEHFPTQFGNVDLETYYKAINKVKPSLIRVEADEATYNLHIMLRQEIEIGLLEGEIKVKDLPEAWNSRVQEYLGITPSNDAEGVLQDVHWSFGYMGYFATYAIGNLVAQQIWDTMIKDIPDIDDQIRKGEFSKLLSWLNEKIHIHANKFEPQELVERITGSKIDGGPFIKYLNEKYGEIYGL